MTTKNFEISHSFIGGYKKKDVDDYCAHLKNILEDTQNELNSIRQTLEYVQQENADLEKKLEKAEVYYRGLWEKCKVQEATLDRQHQLLTQLTSKSQPLKQVSQKISQWKQKSIGLLNIGGDRNID